MNRRWLLTRSVAVAAYIATRLAYANAWTCCCCCSSRRSPPVLSARSTRSHPDTITLSSKDNDAEDAEGSIFGASLLFAGTAIGAGSF